MSGSASNVKGLAEIKQVMGQLPDKIERNLMRGAMRAGGKVFLKGAADNINTLSGELEKSLRVGTRIKGGQVQASVKAGPSKKNRKAWYAVIVHKGAKKHIIKARRAKMLAIGVKQVTHPGAAPNEYLLDSAEQLLTPAVVAVADHLRKRLASKYGIDVPDPLEEGDDEE